MITILHGDDISASRKRFIELKQQSGQPILLEGSVISLDDVIQTFSNEQLFSDTKDIFIENFFSKRKLIAKETKAIIEYLNKKAGESSLTFWESKKMTPAALKSFPKAIAQLYTVPQTLFKFIDAIYPNHGKELVNLFHDTLNQSEPELIFFLMVKQLRILLSMALGSRTDELKSVAPWQFQNLQRQLRTFPVDEIKKSYKKLFEIDYQTKTGRTSLSLTQSIDIFLLGL